LLNILLCFPSLDMFFSFSFWLLPNKIVLIPFSHVKHTHANWDWYFILFFWDDNIFWDKKKWITMIYQPILPPTCIVHGRPPPKVSSMFQNKVYSWSKPVRLDLSSTIPMISEGLIWSLERRLIGTFSNTKARLVQLGTENFDDSTWIGTSDILSPE